MSALNVDCQRGIVREFALACLHTPLAIAGVEGVDHIVDAEIAAVGYAGDYVQALLQFDTLAISAQSAVAYVRSQIE